MCEVGVESYCPRTTTTTGAPRRRRTHATTTTTMERQQSTPSWRDNNYDVVDYRTQTKLVKGLPWSSRESLLQVGGWIGLVVLLVVGLCLIYLCKRSKRQGSGWMGQHSSSRSESADEPVSAPVAAEAVSASFHPSAPVMQTADVVPKDPSNCGMVAPLKPPTCEAYQQEDDILTVTADNAGEDANTRAYN